MKLPDDCTDMGDIRAEIDRLDRALMALFAQRAGYIDRAAVIKVGAGLPARIPKRVDQVMENIADLARENGLPPQVYIGIWRDLVDWSIAREDQILGKE